MFLGINIICALLRAHFNPCLRAWAKMSLCQAQNIFMPMTINSIVYYYHFVGHCGSFYELKINGEFGELNCILAR